MIYLYSHDETIRERWQEALAGRDDLESKRLHDLSPSHARRSGSRVAAPIHLGDPE